LDYRENEFLGNLKAMYFKTSKKVFKDINNSKFVDALNEAKKISQRLQGLRVEVAEAEKKLSGGQFIFYAVICLAIVAAYILYDSISSAFYGFNPLGFWSISSLIYLVYSFRHYKSWKSGGESILESKIKSTKSEEITCINEINKIIDEINSLWINGSETEVMNS
jgi:hypothetical protein